MKALQQRQYVAWAIFLGLIALMLIREFWEVERFLNHQLGYYLFPIGDWLINYQGGFVRRGLLGECFYQLYALCPYPVAHAIAGVYYSSFIAFAYVFGRFLIKSGLSIFLLPTSICLFFGLGVEFITCRRDYLALLIAFYVFYIYFRYVQSRKVKYFVVFALLSILTLLMHEASFFFTFPLLFLHYLSMGKATASAVAQKLLLFVPAGLTMLLVSYYKGNNDLAHAVWHSWLPTFMRYPLDGSLVMSEAVEFLSKDVTEALRMHVPTTWLYRLGHPVVSILANGYIFVATYYLVTGINRVHLGLYRLRKINAVVMSNILIVQFVCLIPMFGFLSNDLGRTIPYWVITSLLFYGLYMRFGAQRTMPYPLRRLTALSIHLQRWIRRRRWLTHPYAYMLCAVTLPLTCYAWSRLQDAMPLLLVVKVIKRMLLSLL